MTALTDYLDAIDADAENARDEDAPRLTAALRDIEAWCDGAHQCDNVKVIRRILGRITDTGSEQ